MIKMLDNAIKKSISKITSNLPSEESIAIFNAFPITNPQDIIIDLKNDITNDFPEVTSVNCKIKYIPESLAKYLSPAFYLTPPIDRYSDNYIYINGNDYSNLSMIYTTIAHEGYPGHLYQNVYFRSKSPEPIRNLINITGYVEGWAIYAEMYSYHTSGIDEYLADYLEQSRVLNLSMCARVDIGIHYEGWNRSDVIDYFSKFYNDEKYSGEIYDTIIGEPAIYLPYAIGYLEIMDLREKAERELGDKFEPIEFNEFLLDIGPAQFSIISDHTNLWIKEKKD